MGEDCAMGIRGIIVESRNREIEKSKFEVLGGNRPLMGGSRVQNRTQTEISKKIKYKKENVTARKETKNKKTIAKTPGALP